MLTAYWDGKQHNHLLTGHSVRATRCAPSVGIVTEVRTVKRPAPPSHPSSPPCANEGEERRKGAVRGTRYRYMTFRPSPREKTTAPSPQGHAKFNNNQQHEEQFKLNQILTLTLRLLSQSRRDEVTATPAGLSSWSAAREGDKHTLGSPICPEF